MKTFVCLLVCLPFWGAVYAQKAVAPASRVAATVDHSGGGASLDMVGGQRLLRNGIGYRMKGSIKVSQIELFAVKKFDTLEELNGMEGPKRVAISVLAEVPSNFMGKGLTRGIEDNTPKSQLPVLVPMLIRMGEIFNQHKTLSTGSKVLIDWVPGQGMLLSINGVVQGEPFRDVALFRAMMGIWLGSMPVDLALKNELLGQSGTPSRKD